MDEQSRRRKVYVVTLGCAKNRVDTEQMMGLLCAQGHQVVTRLEEADTALVNTCGFLQAASEEAVDTILALAEEKKRGALERIIVTGCFVQRYGYKLSREIPEVDGWAGTGLLERVPDLVMGSDRGDAAPFYIERPGHLPDHRVPRVLSTPFYTAYLRIAEGCSHRCSYCLIPRLRGPLRSRRPGSILQEARQLADQGVVELNVVAQDTTRYGQDLETGTNLEDLLQDLAHVAGIRWVRLLYAHPEGVTQRLLELLSSHETLCPYLDIPFQHVNREILARMDRAGTRLDPSALVERIRGLPGPPISLRTTLMVGFPGETDAAFQELCDFVERAQFDHLGVFVFSPEPGTRAARFQNLVPPEEAERRRDHILGLQREILKRKHSGLVGRTLKVLVEGPCTETELLLQGRTRRMAPEVDGRVLINKGTGIPGKIMDVRITEAHAYDLVGEII